MLDDVNYLVGDENLWVFFFYLARGGWGGLLNEFILEISHEDRST